jgi:hypothetical protein
MNWKYKQKSSFRKQKTGSFGKNLKLKNIKKLSTSYFWLNDTVLASVYILLWQNYSTAVFLRDLNDRFRLQRIQSRRCNQMCS